MDTQLIALDPGAMVTAQRDLVLWCENKIGEVREELRSAQETLQAVHNAGLNDARSRHLLKSTMKRVTFYEKVKAALAAGYYLIPPFPVQAFAVRSKNANPPRNESVGQSWRGDEVPVSSLPVGEGENHSAVALREATHHVDSIGSDGKTVKKWVWENIEWKDVEFPLEVTRPELVTAVGNALRLKIFDMLGVMPAYRKADPMIVGQIKHWKANRPPVTFFVAWWIDTRDL